MFSLTMSSQALYNIITTHTHTHTLRTPHTTHHTHHTHTSCLFQLSCIEYRRALLAAALGAGTEQQVSVVCVVFGEVSERLAEDTSLTSVVLRPIPSALHNQGSFTSPRTLTVLSSPLLSPSSPLLLSSLFFLLSLRSPPLLSYLLPPLFSSLLSPRSSLLLFSSSPLSYLLTPLFSSPLSPLLSSSPPSYLLASILSSPLSPPLISLCPFLNNK